jgi:hypothetical protein
MRRPKNSAPVSEAILAAYIDRRLVRESDKRPEDFETGDFAYANILPFHVDWFSLLLNIMTSFTNVRATRCVRMQIAESRV